MFLRVDDRRRSSQPTTLKGASIASHCVSKFLDDLGDAGGVMWLGGTVALVIIKR